jgi:Restriction endonuclease
MTGFDTLAVYGYHQIWYNTGRRVITVSTVLVYNLGGKELLGRVRLHQAINMLHKEKATVFEAVEGQFFGKYPFPKAIQLVRYVYAKWKYEITGKVPFKKIGVLRRDNFTCAYCGVTGERKVTSVDHVFPKWQGGTLTWNNAVAACVPCNFKKAGRTPEEAGMPIKYVKRYEPMFRDAYRFVHGTDRY